MLFTSQIDGLDDTRRWLSGVASRMRDPRPALEKSGARIVENTRGRVARGRDVEGRAFVPSRRVREHGGTTLFLTGSLARSAIARVVGNTLMIESSDVRAGVLFAGSVRRNLPERHWLGASAAELGATAEDVGTFVTEGAG